jgi:hypothetical protein
MKSDGIEFSVRLILNLNKKSHLYWRTCYSLTLCMGIFRCIFGVTISSVRTENAWRRSSLSSKVKQSSRQVKTQFTYGWIIFAGHVTRLGFCSWLCFDDITSFCHSIQLYRGTMQWSIGSASLMQRELLLSRWTSDYWPTCIYILMKQMTLVWFNLHSSSLVSTFMHQPVEPKVQTYGRWAIHIYLNIPSHVWFEEAYTWTERGQEQYLHET